MRAFNGAGESADSNLDLATTVIFTDAVLTRVAARTVHFTELRTAVNAIRALARLDPFNFTDSTLDRLTPVKATHIVELRAALNSARIALGFHALSFTDPNVVPHQTMIKATHILELRAAVQ